MCLFILEIQNKKRDENESCVSFYCPKDSIKPENQWLFCTKMEGNNSKSNEELLQSLSNVNSANSLINILECVQWKACFKYNGIQLNNYTKIRNNSCNFNHLNCNSNCLNEKHSEKEFIEKEKYLFLFFGIIAMIGNLVVIFFVSKKLLFVATVKENTVYNILVLNLSFADLLIAVYVIIFSSITCKLNDVICDVLGVMSVTGFQVGTTIIALICAYRLHGVLRPFSLISKKFLLISLLFVWIVWLVFSLLPIISPDVFFSNKTGRINFALESIKSITLNEMNNTDVFSALLKTVLKFNCSEVYTQLFKSLGIYGNMKFYNQNRACTIGFSKFKSNGMYFMLAMLSYNSLSLFFILIAYTTIFLRIFNCRNLITRFFFQSPNNGRKAKEGLKVFKKIFIIVATNFVCWATVCNAGVYFFSRSLDKSECSYSKFLQKHYIVLKVMLLLALINPLLNPYIYCIKFWKILFKCCKTKIFVPSNMLQHFKFF